MLENIEKNKHGLIPTKKLVEQAIEILGNKREVARSMGISDQRLYGWVKFDRPITGGYAIKLEHATLGKLPRWYINPIHYPPEEYNK